MLCYPGWVKDILAIIAALLAVAGNVPYVRNTITGHVRPHPYTWLVSSIVSATVLAGMLAKGAGVGALPAAVSGAFTIGIFFLSLKYGYNGATKSDRLFLFAALLGLIPWALTHDPTVSVVIAVAIDIASFVPTFRKTWAHPTTEAPVLYGSNVLRHVLALLSLQTYNVATSLHSIAMIVLNSGMLGVIFRKRV